MKFIASVVMANLHHAHFLPLFPSQNVQKAHFATDLDID